MDIAFAQTAADDLSRSLHLNDGSLPVEARRTAVKPAIYQPPDCSCRVGGQTWVSLSGCCRLLAGLARVSAW